MDFRMYEAYVQSSTHSNDVHPSGEYLTIRDPFSFFASIWKKIQNYEINYIKEKYAF